MPKLQTGAELMETLSKYNCLKQVNDALTRMILQLKKESGQLRVPVIVTDCRGSFVLGPKYPTLYFEAAFDYRWIRASKIIKPGHPPDQDKLSIGAIAAEQLTEEEYAKVMEKIESEKVLDEAKNIINKNEP